MNMVLCHACKRHIFAKESSCPFCGVLPTAPTALSPTQPRPMATELSRAERYAIGAAMAVSVATAGCSSPTTVHNADEIRTVDVNTTPDGSGASGDTGAGNGSNNDLEVARDPQGNETQLADPEAERRRREELEQRRRDEALRRQKDEQPPFWHNRPPCQGNICPPYGCVFPDEACDVVRA